MFGKIQNIEYRIQYKLQKRFCIFPSFWKNLREPDFFPFLGEIRRFKHYDGARLIAEEIYGAYLFPGRTLRKEIKRFSDKQGEKNVEE